MRWLALLIGLSFLGLPAASGMGADGDASEWRNEPLLHEDAPRDAGTDAGADILGLKARLEPDYLHVLLLLRGGPAPDGTQFTYGVDVDCRGDGAWDFEVLVGGDGRGGVGSYAFWVLEPPSPRKEPVSGLGAALGDGLVELAIPRAALGEVRLPLRLRGLVWSHARQAYADTSEGLPLERESRRGATVPVAIRLDGGAEDWASVPRIAIDPRGDSTGSEPGLDLRGLRALQSGADLFVLIETAGTPVLSDAAERVYGLNLGIPGEPGTQVGVFGGGTEMFGQVVWARERDGTFTPGRPVDGVIAVAGPDALEILIPLWGLQGGATPIHLQAFAWEKPDRYADFCPNVAGLALTVPEQEVRLIDLERRFRATYTFSLHVAGGLERLDLFIPVPTVWDLQPGVGPVRIEGPGGMEPAIQVAPGMGRVAYFPLLDVAPGDYAVTETVEYRARARQRAFSKSAASEGLPEAFLGPTTYIQSNDADVAALARTLGEGASAPIDKARRVFDWVLGELRYTEVGDMIGARKALETRIGNCGDHSALVTALLRANDIPARLVSGFLEGDDRQHVWAEAYLEGTWFPMDTSFKGYRYFGTLDSGRLVMSKGTDLPVEGVRPYRCPVLQRGFYWYYGGSPPVHRWSMKIEAVE